jgi:large subunit ribosomal protein L18
MNRSEKIKLRRRQRVRNKIKLTSSRPRLSVFVSNKYIYAQVFDASNANVLASASSLQIRKNLKSTSNVEAAIEVGKALGASLAEKKIKEVVFDKREYKYHGKVKRLADQVRSQGINF